jgi:tetratricopeptide (TPR) repeat protein
MAFGRICEKSSIFIALALTALVCSAGCGGGKAVLVGEEPLEKVEKAEDNLYALKAWVVSRAKADMLIHIDTSDDLQIFPDYHRENIKNAAAHLKRGNVDVIDQLAPLLARGGAINLGYSAGLFKRVVWVLPTQVSVGDDPEGFKAYLMQRRGYSYTRLRDLAADGKNMTGMLAGVPITITSFDDLEIGSGDAILSIDLAYFLGARAVDPAHRPGTRAVIDFLRRLAAGNVWARFATVVLSTDSGTCPLDIRFYGDMIKEALADPLLLEEPLPEKWTAMIEAEDSLVAGNFHAAERIYENLTERHPRDPGLHFALAVTKGFLGEGGRSGEEILNAYEIDGAYGGGFFQLANVLAVGGRMDTGVEIISTKMLSRIVTPYELDYKKGIFFMNGGRPEEAITYLERAVEMRPKDFLLHSLLFKAQRDAGRRDDMALTFEKLREIDESRIGSETPWVLKDMGAMYESVPSYDRAVEMYERFLEHVPGDSSARELREKIEHWKRADR